MKLSEALKICHAAAAAGCTPLHVGLACGFTPLHLESLLAAHLQLSIPQRRVEMVTGLFGDCLGNLKRLAADPPEAAALIVEWVDLDGRLGLRQAGGWQPSRLDDILATLRLRRAEFAEAIAEAAGRTPLAVCLPTLPPPSVATTATWQAGSFETALQAEVAELAQTVARLPRAKLVSSQHLDLVSPTAGRHDVNSDLGAGFPYQVQHADHVAQSLARLLLPPTPTKGIITDLDDVLWQGLVGEEGAAAVRWDLDSGAHIHALYQQMLAALAEAGVLIAVASKNDPREVEAALARRDLLIPPRQFFPVEVSWQPKSAAVGRILQAWNVGAESVIFVDDSPLELAEVQAAHPQIHCLRFPPDDEQAAYGLLWALRDLCGKAHLSPEDTLRAESLRARHEQAPPADRGAADGETFLSRLEARLSLSLAKEPLDARALELVNKTNQFNLNGRRWTEGQWQALLARPDVQLLTASYEDKFGPLGKIAVVAGRLDGAQLHVEAWAMSCRAFSRRIEFQVLKTLCDELGVERLSFDYQHTEKNGPLSELLANLLGQAPKPGCVLTSARLAKASPPLYHQVEILRNGAQQRR